MGVEVGFPLHELPNDLLDRVRCMMSMPWLLAAASKASPTRRTLQPIIVVTFVKIHAVVAVAVAVGGHHTQK